MVPPNANVPLDFHNKVYCVRWRLLVVVRNVGAKVGVRWVVRFFKFEWYKVTSMNELPERNSLYMEKGMTAELISQQQELILVLKQEIVRLQE